MRLRSLCSFSVAAVCCPVAFGNAPPIPQPLSLAAPAVMGCEWEADQLRVTWPAVHGADYYELQVSDVSDSDGERAFAIFSTADTVATLDFLLPGRGYSLRLRSHAAGMPNLAPGSWGRPGQATTCTTGPAGQRAAREADEAVKTFTLEVMRGSEWTRDVDYLMNHNSADVLGEVTAIIISDPPPDPSWFFQPLENMTFTVYCLEVMHVELTDTITTEGNSAFADYGSCNLQDDVSDPQCFCAAWQDRILANVSLRECWMTSFPLLPCLSHYTLMNGLGGCTCECPEKSLAQSATHIGMEPVYFAQPERLGAWYSHPKATECSESETVGAARPGGAPPCTWKRRSDARVLYGRQLLQHGWNRTHFPPGPKTSPLWPVSMDPMQVHQNTAVVRAVLASSPALPWRCDANPPSAPSRPTLVV